MEQFSEEKVAISQDMQKNMKHYCEEQSTVLNALETNRETGLTESEASTRLLENGRNKLAAAKKKSSAKTK